MVLALPRNRTADAYASQVLRAAGSVGANYAESAHGSSRRHFVSILEVSRREARESRYWLRVIAKSGLIKPHRLKNLIQEAEELLSIITKSIVTTKRQAKS